jgi:hypothetical protein
MQKETLERKSRARNFRMTERDGECSLNNPQKVDISRKEKKEEEISSFFPAEGCATSKTLTGIMLHTLISHQVVYPV